jgi:hypothetical protein
MDHYYQSAVVYMRFDQNVQELILLHINQAHNTDIKQVVYMATLTDIIPTILSWS